MPSDAEKFNELAARVDLSAMAQGAAAMYEMFCNLLGAGFSEDQGLRLVAYMTMTPRKDEGES